MKKGILIGIAVAAVFIAAIIGGGFSYVHSMQNSGTFLRGTIINDVNVSGKNPEQAQELLTENFLDRQVAVEENDREVLRLSLTELGYTADGEAVRKALEQCMDTEKKDFDSVMKGLAGGSRFQVAVPYTVDDNAFAGAVRADALSVPRKENVNAKILYYKEDQECRIQPEVQGTELRDEDLQSWLKGEIDLALKEDKRETGTVSGETAETAAAAAEETASEAISEETQGTENGTAQDAGAAAQADAPIPAGRSSEDESGDIVCRIPASLYVLPEKRAQDEDRQKKCEILNEYADESITYVFGDQTETLTFETIMDWLKIKDGKVSVKEDKVQKYVRSLAEKYETRYMDRVFHTSLGTDVTFPAGLNEYGYTILEDLEAQQLTQDILSGEPVEREPVYQYLGPWGDPLYLRRSGTDDLAGTYVEVSISAQHMWYYIDGALFIESDVVTGDATLGQDTATGVFPLAFKESPATLRGGEGKKKYTTKVQYWMPFYEGQGLHDAWWKTVFGGNEYMGNGSHGCVNLPSSVAEAVYNNIQPGTAIIIYY